MDFSYPLKTIKLSNKDQPWVTPFIKNLMKEKDKAYHKSNKMKYLALRERLLKAVARNKKAYFKSACSMNPKKAWHSINSLIRENKRNDKQLSHADLEKISNIFKKVFEPEDLFYVDDDNEKKRIGEY